MKFMRRQYIQYEYLFFALITTYEKSTATGLLPSWCKGCTYSRHWHATLPTHQCFNASKHWEFWINEMVLGMTGAFFAEIAHFLFFDLPTFSLEWWCQNLRSYKTNVAENNKGTIQTLCLFAFSLWLFKLAHFLSFEKVQRHGRSISPSRIRVVSTLVSLK